MNGVIIITMQSSNPTYISNFCIIIQVAEEIWVCEKQTVTKWTGDISSYKETLKKLILKDDVKTVKAQKGPKPGATKNGKTTNGKTNGVIKNGVTKNGKK